MKKRPHLNQKEKKALQEFKQKLKKELGSDFLELKLFGSKARGDSRKDSDIDVLVIAKKDTSKVRDKIIDTSMETLHKYDDIYISTHVYSKKDYMRYCNIPTVFMQIIKQEAISLWNRLPIRQMNRSKK